MGTVIQKFSSYFYYSAFLGFPYLTCLIKVSILPAVFMYVLMYLTDTLCLLDLRQRQIPQSWSSWDLWHLTFCYRLLGVRRKAESTGLSCTHSQSTSSQFP
jgi:hypothetical protein